MDIFGSLSTDVGSRITNFVNSIDFGPLLLLDLFLVGIILYWLFSALRGTRAMGIIYGILILVAMFIVARALDLVLLQLLIANFLTLLFVAIPVLFQPELRRALEKLGTRFRTLHKIGARKEYKATVETVAEAVKILSTSKTGALIVFKRDTGLADVGTSGTQLDAKLSVPLLLNLFFDKSPLHDGAVIIDRDRISAAGVMLPLSEREYNYTLGARHRAAVGLTEQCDAVVIVVSEETGVISFVVGGKITPGISIEAIPKVLQEFLNRKHPGDMIKKIRKPSKTKTKAKK